MDCFENNIATGKNKHSFLNGDDHKPNFGTKLYLFLFRKLQSKSLLHELSTSFDFNMQTWHDNNIKMDMRQKDFNTNWHLTVDGFPFSIEYFTFYNKISGYLTNQMESPFP